MDHDEDDPSGVGKAEESQDKCPRRDIVLRGWRLSTNDAAVQKAVLFTYAGC